MSLVVNYNSASQQAQNSLRQTQSQLNQSIERLSSGKKINSAKDNAAGQAIANRFTAQVNGLNQASNNANDGISLAQTTEGALNQINNNLQRIRTLSVQAANGTNSASDKQSIQAEVQQRLDEINRVSSQTSFNGVKVLDGTTSSVNIQVGAQDGQTISIGLSKINASALSLSSFALGASASVDVTSSTYTAASTTANPIAAIDSALATVNSARSKLGAAQNRFDSAINNIQSTKTNLSSAKSRIVDTNYADEVSKLSKAKILNQAGQSVLAQANQTQQGVLSLLRNA